MTVIPQLERQLASAARGRRRRNLRAATVAVVVAVAVGALLVIPALLDSKGSGGEPRNVPAKPGPTSANPPLEDLLGVFRRERTLHDKANFTLGDLEATHDRQPGESPADSRRVDLPSGPVYLWRMKDGVCASWGNCLRTGSLAQLRVAVAAGGHSGSDGRPRLFEISGIVVDGIDQVQIGAEHSDQLVIPVKDNVFHADLSRSDIQPTRILWREGGRWHRQDLPFP